MKIEGATQGNNLVHCAADDWYTIHYSAFNLIILTHLTLLNHISVLCYFMQCYIIMVEKVCVHVLYVGVGALFLAPQMSSAQKPHRTQIYTIPVTML